MRFLKSTCTKLEYSELVKSLFTAVDGGRSVLTTDFLNINLEIAIWVAIRPIQGGAVF